MRVNTTQNQKPDVFGNFLVMVTFAAILTLYLSWWFQEASDEPGKSTQSPQLNTHSSPPTAKLKLLAAEVEVVSPKHVDENNSDNRRNPPSDSVRAMPDSPSNRSQQSKSSTQPETKAIDTHIALDAQAPEPVATENTASVAVIDAGTVPNHSTGYAEAPDVDSSSVLDVTVADNDNTAPDYFIVPDVPIAEAPVREFDPSSADKTVANARETTAADVVVSVAKDTDIATREAVTMHDDIVEYFSNVTKKTIHATHSYNAQAESDLLAERTGDAISELKTRHELQQKYQAVRSLLAAVKTIGIIDYEENASASFSAEMSDSLATKSRDIQFAVNSNVIPEQMEPILIDISDILSSYDDTRIVVSVLTNESVDAKQDQLLSQERGRAIIARLVSLGIDFSRFSLEATSSSNDISISHAVNIQVQTLSDN